MCQISKRIPLGEHTEEVRVRITNGKVEIVLIDHSGSVQSVPVQMEPAEQRASA
jgi:hypothetical protein